MDNFKWPLKNQKPRKKKIDRLNTLNRNIKSIETRRMVKTHQKIKFMIKFLD